MPVQCVTSQIRGQFVILEFPRVVREFGVKREVFVEFEGLCMDLFARICMRARENDIFAIFLPCTTVHERCTPVHVYFSCCLRFKVELIRFQTHFHPKFGFDFQRISTLEVVSSFQDLPIKLELEIFLREKACQEVGASFLFPLRF